MVDPRKFREWLAKAGAEVKAATSTWEMARWTARGGTHVVYKNKHNELTASGFARECLDRFQNGARPPHMGVTKKPRGKSMILRAALMQRDSSACFYCGYPMTDDDCTVEHLVSVQNGGPSHMDNLALAHEACNRQAANLPLVKKIEMRVAMRAHKRQLERQAERGAA